MCNTKLDELTWQDFGDQPFPTTTGEQQTVRVLSASTQDCLIIATLPPGMTKLRNYTAHDYQQHNPPEDFAIMEIHTPTGDIINITSDYHHIAHDEGGENREVFLVSKPNNFYTAHTELWAALHQALHQATGNP